MSHAQAGTGPEGSALDTSIRGVPVKQRLARALDGPGTVVNAAGHQNAARARSHAVSPTSPTS